MKKYNKICAICNDHFISNWSTTKYCVDCGLKKNKSKYKKVSRDYALKECIVCKIKFKPSSLLQKYCNLRCYQKKDYKSNYLKLRFEIFKRDNFTCQYYGRNVKEDKIKIHCDHIHPKSKGGEDAPENLTTSCVECNLGKGDVLLNKKIFLKKL